MVCFRCILILLCHSVFSIDIRGATTSGQLVGTFSAIGHRVRRLSHLICGAAAASNWNQGNLFELIATVVPRPQHRYLLCPFNYHMPRFRVKLNYISCSQPPTLPHRRLFGCVPFRYFVFFVSPKIQPKSIEKFSESHWFKPPARQNFGYSPAGTPWGIGEGAGTSGATSVKCSNFIGTTGVHIKLIKDPAGAGDRETASSFLRRFLRGNNDKCGRAGTTNVPCNTFFGWWFIGFTQMKHNTDVGEDRLEDKEFN